MNINNFEVANKIKSIRQANGWTLEEFGGKLNTSKVSVHNWESGRNLPNNKRLKEIADLGNMSVNELLYGNELNYVFSILPTENYEEARIFYNNYYIKHYGENSYHEKNNVLEMYESVEQQLKKVAEYSNSITIRSNAHALNAVVLSLDDYLKKTYTNDDKLKYYILPVKGMAEASIRMIERNSTASNEKNKFVKDAVESLLQPFIKILSDEGMDNNVITEYIEKELPKYLSDNKNKKHE